MKLFIVLTTFFAVVLGAAVPELGSRIVGGNDASIEFYPYQLSLQYEGQHICGGSILTSKMGLTACHCVHKMDQKQYSVRVGATKHNDGIFIRVTDIKEHEQYNSKTEENDVALIKFENPLSFSSTIQPVPLQPSGIEVLVGTTCWVSGWGATSEGSQAPNDNLKAADVTIISSKECSSRYGAGKITTDMLCAQNEGEDACLGDSGGPLVANERLVGVVSWGYGCARPQYPGVYVSVSVLNKWITSNLQ